MLVKSLFGPSIGVKSYLKLFAGLSSGFGVQSDESAGAGIVALGLAGYID